MFEFVGALHIHSKYSDGSGEVEDIAGFAVECNLDYLILTDHNTLRAYSEGYERWFNDTLFLVGCEINDKENKNHYLAMGINKSVSTRLKPQEYIDEVNKMGGIGFLAHPHEKRSSMKEHPPYPWTEWEATGYTGMEIWNHMSEWMEGLTEQNKYNYFVHPLKSIDSPCLETVKKWDEINLERKCVGIGGIDAHAHKLNLLGFFEVEVFPYKVLFQSIRTHILVDQKIKDNGNKLEVAEAKTLLYKSLKEGKCFIANYYHGDAKGFRYFAEDGNRIYQMGETVELNGKVKLRVILPNESGTIKLIYNGKEIDAVNNVDAEFIVSKKGVYRVEVYLDDKAWIFSNHIRIGL